MADVSVPHSPCATKRKAVDAVESSECSREELCRVRKWVEEGNAVATALIRLAVHVPTAFTSVADYEAKLYTALTNVVWVHDESASAYLWTMRKASGLAAFIDSMLGKTKMKTYLDGPYCGVHTGENLSPDHENEMHSLLRGLGFKKRDVPDNFLLEREFWETLKATYHCDAWRCGEKRARGGEFEADRPVWEKAVSMYRGEDPK